MIDLASTVDRVIRRWPTPEARRWVIAFLQEAANDDDTLAVVALGSAVRPSVESEDLDLLVLCRDGGRRQWRAPIEIDLRSYEISDVSEELEVGADLITWAVKFGVALYDPKSAWQKVVASWKQRLRLPNPELAERRADAAHTHLEALRKIGDSTAANEVQLSYLTHLARASLSRAGTFPASRPELGGQLRAIGEHELAGELDVALAERKRLASESAAV